MRWLKQLLQLNEELLPRMLAIHSRYEILENCLLSARLRGACESVQPGGCYSAHAFRTSWKVWII
jgi:hypothetical protein